ncbi:MAG: hypothetical protein M3R55_00150 [Acidobacteriota bacterium]|nr:hypothetical protein [Acidobacteriota bacterium]
MLRRTLGPVVCLGLVMSAAACETAKSSNPLSPAIAGPIEGVVLTPPKPIEPLANQQIRDKDQPFNIVIENATTTSPRAYKMRMQIATDGNFSQVVWSRDGIDPAEGGQTRFRMPDRLQPGRQYFWRVMADDGANTSPWSDPSGFQVLMPAEFGAPTPRSPVANALVEVRPELRVGNGSAQGPVAQAFYLFQVSSNSSFSNVIINEEAAQQSGETKLVVPGQLSYATTYYWRARISDGDTVGPWSPTESFRTGAAPAPTPGPAPGPTPTGGSCVLASGDAIMTCNRNRYTGFMQPTQVVAFLSQSAKDLNAAGISGAPFGILVKPGGYNCNGYSCDILCSGNGSGQRQWDVLSDSDGAQRPVFVPVSADHVLVRTCIQQ